MAASGSGVLTGQSLPAARRAPARCRAPNGYCQPARSSPRNGSVSSTIWSSRQAHSACMLAVTPSVGEPRHVVGVDHLEVGDVVARLAMAALAQLGPRSNASSASPHRAVADRVHVHLEALGVEPGHVAASARRVDERQARGWRSAWPQRSRYGEVSAAVQFSATPSCMTLTELGTEPAVGEAPPPLEQVRDLLVARGRGPTTARRTTWPVRSPAGRRAGRSADGSSHAGVVADDRVLPAGDAERVQVAPARPAARGSTPRRIVAGTSAATSAIAPSCSVPVGRPSASRSIRPSAGSGVSRVDAGELERPRC